MKWRVTLFLVVLLGISVYGLNQLYYSIGDKLWQENSNAVETAYEKSLLVKAVKAEPYYGELPYTIVYGEDKLGQKMIVWVGENEVHSEFEASGSSKDDIKNMLLAKAPDAQVLRISPGKLKDAYVWEVFYKRKEQQGERYYYDYYSFNGQDLDHTYTLSVH